LKGSVIYSVEIVIVSSIGRVGAKARSNETSSTERVSVYVIMPGSSNQCKNPKTNGLVICSKERQKKLLLVFCLILTWVASGSDLSLCTSRQNSSFPLQLELNDATSPESFGIRKPF
jgi:hypothetical protein